MTDHKAIASILERLDRDVISRQLVERFCAEIPGYQRLPRSVLDTQILRAARGSIELCFESIARGISPDLGALDPFRASARDRATEGMPLEDLLHAYRLSGRLAWRAIAESAHPDEQATLIEVAERMMRYVDDVSATVAQAYLDERQQLVSEEERTARDLFEAILRDVPIPARIELSAERRGFALADRYQPFVARIPGSSGRRHGELAAVMRREGTLALTEGDRVAGLLPAGARPRGLPQQALTVIGGESRRRDLAGAIGDVRTIAEIAERRGLTGIVDTAGFPLELLLISSPWYSRAIAERVLGPLGDGDSARGAELLQTLDAFVEHGLDRRATAAALHIHPNTLDYRLRRVRELNQLDLRDPDAIALVVLALRQRRLREG